MILSRLEEDLLGDMSQDDHELREVFEFVRLHHGDDLSTVRQVGRALLVTWHARRWLSIVDRPPAWPGYQAGSIDEVVRLVDEAESLGADFRGAATWLRLTPQAFQDVGWLAPAS
jgi:hypothetical protein